MPAATLRFRTSHPRVRSFVRPSAAVLICLIVSVGCRLTCPCTSGPPFHGGWNEVRKPLLQGTSPVARQVLTNAAPLDEGGTALLAALAAWDRLEARVAAGDEQAWSSDDADAYHEQVARFVRCAMRGGSIDGAAGITILGPEGPLCVPLVLRGFAWSPEDVNRLFTYQWSTYPKVKQRHLRAGIGTPLVAVRKRNTEETYFLQLQPFAVTALLRRTDARPDAPSVEPSVVLELHNPLAVRQVAVGDRTLPLRGDQSASIEYMLHIHERNNPTVAGFLRPGEGEVRARLTFVEPYQAGKIPLVFIHGLASDGATWLDTLNELNVDSEVYDRYQMWAFRYPTGRGFLESATELRQRLFAARQDCDPEHRDSKLDRMILVGHSMGGLLTKLQVTSSRDCLWRSIGRVPFEELEVSPDTRQRLTRSLFFEPVPSIRRVVFIGTPHRGASLASRPLARLASKAVAYSPEEDAAYRNLVLDNLERLRPWAWYGQPTSIDMLVPENPLLSAILELPIADGVRTHSIIGTKGLVVDGRSDGVVDVSSARHPRVESEVYVPEHHSGLQQHPATIAELTRILEEHWRESGE